MKGIARKISESSSQSHTQEGKGRVYVTWSKEMDATLVVVLVEQMNQGNKADGDWKPQAYQAAVEELNATLNLRLTKDNVKNRLKIWKRHYAVITDITSQSGFPWDDDKKMVPITAENNEIWLGYVKSHPDARGYQNKVIENWDEIVMLCSKDRATGGGAANIVDDDEAMARVGENELVDGVHSFSSQPSHAQPSTSAHSPSSSRYKKRQRKDPLADAISEMATSVKEYIASKKKEYRPAVEEIYDVVSKVEGLVEGEVFNAVQRLMNGSVGEFTLLKCLPDDKKRAWIHSLLK